MAKLFMAPVQPAKRTLFPEQHQFVIGHVEGQSYLSSLWIGFTAPLINLPIMLWRSVIKPPFYGLFFIVQFFILAMVAGLCGRAHGFVIDMPTISYRITSVDGDTVKEDDVKG
jgi:hypothetical protein